MFLIARIFTITFRSKFGLIALGLVIAAFSFSFKPANPSCGDERMNPGDACVNEITDEVRTYEDMAEEERNELFVARFGGLGLAAAGVALYVVRRRKATQAQAAPVPHPAYAYLPAPPVAPQPATVPTHLHLPAPPAPARPATISPHGQAF
jgi:hypothetical protein